MKWSTALFGHRQAQTLGWEKRCEPGDLIDFKPEKCWNCDEQQHKEIVRMLHSRGYLMTHRQEIKDRFIERSTVKSWRAGARFDRIWKGRFLRFGLSDPALLPEDVRSYFSFLPGASMWHLHGRSVWGKIERMAFLIVNVDGPTKEQLSGLAEPYWDTNSYRNLEPMSKSEFEAERVNKAMSMGKMGLELEDLPVEEAYEKHLKALEELSLYPTDYIKKRRMNVPLDTLQSLGVDLEKMLNRNLRYEPDVEVVLPHCWDKLKVRNIEASDKLRRIDPVIRSLRNG